MEIKTPKKLVGLTAFLLFATVLLLLLFLFSIGKGSYGGAFIPSPVKAFVRLDGKEVFSSDGIMSLSGEKSTFELENKEKEEISFLFLFQGDPLGEVTLSSGEKTEYALEHPQGKLSLILRGERKNTAYFAEEKSFSAIAPSFRVKTEMFFFDSPVLQNVTLQAPCRLFGDFSVHELEINTDLEGDIVFCPDASLKDIVYIRAPFCKVYFRNFSLPSRWDKNYCLKAKSLNGKSLSPSLYPISDFDQLKRLSEEDCLPQLSENAELRFISPFALKDDVSFSQHLSLTFEAAVDFASFRMLFANREEGRFSVKADIGATPDATSLLFDAPYSHLTWESLGTVPAVSTVEKYDNLKTYNGIPLTLGGEGAATPILTLSAAENEFLEEDVSFAPRYNMLWGNLPFSVNAEDLSGANYTLSCENGKAYLEGSLTDGVIIAVDEAGKEKRFAMEILREKKQIPVLYLETEDGAPVESKSQYLSATFALDGEGTNVPSQNETHIRLRGRGNSTWKWDKKPYKIHFDEPTSILGLPKAEEWALFANYADKSLIRNGLAQEMASILSFDYNPTQVYVDLFLNGEYLGVYTIGEHLEEGEGRIEVIHNMAQRDCGYFMEAGGVVSGVDVKGMNYFHAGLVKFVLIKGPEYNALTSEQFDFIKKYMQKADAAVKAGEGYEEYLDMDTLVDWLIMIELSNNTDCAWRRSTYFVKNPGEKLKMGPVWDFDLAFGNFSKDVAGFDVWVSTSEDDYVGETWSTHLLQDPEFQKRFKARWEEVKDDLLNTAYSYIDKTYEMLYPSAEENFERWDILGKKVAFERHDTKYYKTYTSQILYLRDFLENRSAWLDEQVAQW